MVKKPGSQKASITAEELAQLQQKLEEMEQTLTAIQNGEVDAVVVKGEVGEQVYTLKSAEYPYRVMIEQMAEGALSLSTEGVVLYCNESFARMVKSEVEEIVSSPISAYIGQASLNQFQRLLENKGRGDLSILAKDGTLVWAHMAVNTIQQGETQILSVVITDLTEHIRTEQIIASERFAQALLEQAADAILVCDANGLVMQASEKAFNLLGGKLIGQPLDKVFGQLHSVGVSAATQQSSQPISFAAIRDAQVRQGSEVALTSDGDINLAVLLDYSRITEGDTVLGYSISLTDITERKRAEEDLKRYNVELETANKELEAFSYSVSHDLRAPLRALDGFSEMVIEEYEEKLDARGKDYLNRVRKASQRMSVLIDDLLNLAQISRVEMYQDRVNLSSIATTIAEELRSVQPSTKAEFVIAPDVRAKGDKQLLTIALRNLLENAWKFTSKCPRPRIEFGQVDKNGENVYFVRDNGAGFDMKDAGKLFQAFQRLHSSEEYAGTGIGLAIVHRIVRRHDGRIWAESEKGKGATFYFTLG